MKMQGTAANRKFILQNETAVLHLDALGGIIESFQLQKEEINPLAFKMDGFRGHFLCAGRWGDPSPGEVAAGSVKHGDARLIPWELTRLNEHEVVMHCQSRQEQLMVRRNLTLHPRQARFTVHESLVNTGSIGRLCNLVQHPTIGGEFLSNETEIACNAAKGFRDPLQPGQPVRSMSWPFMQNDRGDICDLRLSVPGSGGVYSFVVKEDDEHGWITAWSPVHRLLLGYVWKRSDFPWINLWLHEEGNRIRYRGLEFGTTGLHMPYDRLLAAGFLKVLDTDTCFYLDAKEEKNFSYTCFLRKMPQGFSGVKHVLLLDNEINIVENE